MRVLEDVAPPTSTHHSRAWVAESTPLKPAPTTLPSNTLAEGRRVLHAEAQALMLLADTLGETFVEAVRLLETVAGRVIVTGIGKSGHVARKIAATLASTGTPACFIHPAEASHGDLGMIGPQDAVLAISASGESAELADTLYYARRIDLPVLAITQHADSRLARAAHVVLLLPDVPEACPLQVAPMTSTTATMAMGDALAAALMERRGFGRDNFRAFHPGGKLGASLSTAAEIMHRGDALPLVAQDSSMTEAITVMSEKRFGCVGIVDGQRRLVGIFTDGDLRRAVLNGVALRAIDDVMSRNPQRVDPDTLVVDVARLMQAKAIPSVFVTNAEDTPLGLIHLHDLLRARVV